MTVRRIAALSFILGAATFTIAPVAVADTTKDIAACAAIKDAVRRLDCYDGLAKKIGVDRPAVRTNRPAGQWLVTTETSKIDDSKNVFLVVPAKNQSIGRFGDLVKPELWLSCRENQTSMWVTMFQFLTTTETDVTYRIDKMKATDRQFAMSTDHEAFGLWRGRAPVDFARGLFGHDTLLMRVTPYGESATTVEFPITGLRDAIKPLAEACHWKTAIDESKWRPEDDIQAK